MANAADMQNFWSDNMVSITVTFKQSEANQIKRCLEAFDSKLKGVSFLPLSEHGYAQAPYIAAPRKEIENYRDILLPLDFSSLTNDSQNLDAIKFCEGDSCLI
jgi:ribonucleoside-triphosphate reductase